jgi:hypothetical protein
MAYTTIDKPTDYFNSVLYTGNGGSKTITGVGFQADFIWFKERSSAGEHKLNVSPLGTNEYLITNSTSGTDTTGSGIQSYNSDGYAVSNASNINDNNETYVTWNWLAGGSSASSNSDGSITSSVSANTTAGFSIVTYTGNGTAGATVGHGLGAVPKWFIVKRRNASGGWVVYHEDVGNTKIQELHDAAASQTSSAAWNNTSPSSSTFTLGDYTSTNTSGGTYIAYCFAEIKGYSKFSSTFSNNSNDGAFAYTGFSPAFVMLKGDVTDTWSDWYIFDNKRKTFNLNDVYLQGNDSAAEDGAGDNYAQIDMLSNGFKIRRDSNWGYGDNNLELYYMAFAESPFVTSGGVPTTAR